MKAEEEVIAQNFYKSKNFLKSFGSVQIVSVNFQKIPICK